MDNAKDLLTYRVENFPLLQFCNLKTGAVLPDLLPAGPCSHLRILFIRLNQCFRPAECQIGDLLGHLYIHTNWLFCLQRNVSSLELAPLDQ